jgi:hypothetical protein
MTVKTKSPIKKIVKKTLSSIDLHKEIIEDFIEKSKEHGVISYEELISFGDKNNVTDQEINEILRIFEKENVELVTQEGLDTDVIKKEEFEELEPARLKLKTKLETYGLESGEFGEELEEEDEDDENGEIKREADSSIADSVKS